MPKFSPAHQSSSDVQPDNALDLLLTIDGSIGADREPRIGWPMEAVALAEQAGDDEEEIDEDEDEDEDEDDEEDDEDLEEDDEDELDEEDEEDELQSRGDGRLPVL